MKVDGNLIDPSNYTAVRGNTVITLKNKYLQTLSPGTHTISVLFTDGEAIADFSVKEQEESSEISGAAGSGRVSPKTGETSMIYVTGVIAMLSLAGMIVCGKKRKA